MSAREYLPSLGRFLSADSIVPGAGNPQALNRYAYVFNNALRYVDPSGHGPICPGCWNPFAGFSFADFVAGFSLQYGDNLALGIPSQANEAVNDALTMNPSEAFQSGRQAADIVGFLQGAVELVGGAASAVTFSAGEVVCIAASAGVCALALPAVAGIDLAAVGVAAHGGAMMITSGSHGDPSKGKWETLERKQKRLENVRKALNQETLEDAAENLKGIYKRWSNGDPIQHLNDVRDNQKYLRDLIKQARGALEAKLPEADIAHWKEFLGQAEELLKYSQEYVP